MPKIKAKPRPLATLIKNVPVLHDGAEKEEDRKAVEVTLKDRGSNATKKITSLPITDHKPVMIETPAGPIISLNIWSPGSPIAATKIDEPGSVKFCEIDQAQKDERIKQMAQYLFEMAQAGAAGFMLQEVPRPGLPAFAILQNELSALCAEYNAGHPGAPINLELRADLFTPRTDSSTFGECPLINTEKLQISAIPDDELSAGDKAMAGQAGHYIIKTKTPADPPIEFNIHNVHADGGDANQDKTKAYIDHCVGKGHMVCGDFNLYKSGDIKDYQPVGVHRVTSVGEDDKLDTADGFYDPYTPKRIIADMLRELDPEPALPVSPVPPKPTTTLASKAEEEDLGVLSEFLRQVKVAAGQRSILAMKYMENQEWALREKDGEHFVDIERTKDGAKTTDTYQVMSGGVTDFTHGKYVSVGSSNDREIIVLDTESKLIKEKYDELKNNIEQFIEKYKKDNGNAEPPLDKVMQVIFDFTRKTLGTVDARGNKIPYLDTILNQFIGKRKKDPAQEQHKDHPIINLDEFIQNKKGVCRHHGLLLAHFLDKLQKEAVIPKGRVHHARDNVVGGAHVWVMYQPDQKAGGKDQLFLADSLWNKFGDILDPEKAKELAKGYGAAISNCEKRFNRPEIVEVAIEPPVVAPVVEPVAGPPPPPPPPAGKITPAAAKPTTVDRTNLISGMDEIKKYLTDNHAGWTVNETNKLQQIVMDENGNPRFTVTPVEMKTDRNDPETFKAMLECFKAANPGVMPKVTAFNDEGKKEWEAAVKDVYKTEIAAGKKIEVQVAPTLPPPAPKIDPAKAAAAAAATPDPVDPTGPTI